MLTYDNYLILELPEISSLENKINLKTILPTEKEEFLITSFPSSKFLRLYIKEILKFSLAIDPGPIETIVGELSTNIERHAKSKIGIYQVHLKWDSTTKNIYLKFIDYGKGFDYKEVSSLPNERESYDSFNIRYGGFGLRLASSLSKEFIVTRTDLGMIVEIFL